MSEKKESGVTSSKDFFGLLEWSFGMLSVMFALIQPIAGFILGVVGIIINKKSKRYSTDKWSRVGKILNIIGIIVAIVAIIASYLVIRYLASNPDLLSQIQGAY